MQPSAPSDAACSPGSLPCEAVGQHPEFVHLSTIPGIVVDIRYAGPSNFAGRNLYAGLDCAWLRRPAAQGLARAAQWLSTSRPGHRLLVLDALRPQRVQEAIWQDVRGTHMAAYFAEPVRGSIHSFGMAVDVTMLDPQGRECDMGSGYDEMNERSHPSLESRHLALGELRAEHLVERGWLYAAMAEGGFVGISTEWWHFDHGDRDQVRQEMQRVV
ncbi:MAG: D-alanyl-D-alanine dipeptidase [Betaproteobacteria bacterium]|nr:D-alanyl-D-alanine dipeptidase [Betaproteobacteria bacterium]NBT09537.1 D-alanyl-D-alanine dipeptidase [Betaproteobacteria bacterium]NBU48634.1 D-alanyl-D-alanine dipeptidase [Betaproteobacteria bacterium]